MEILNNLISGFELIAGIIPLLVIILGVVMGILAGAMPGLSPSMGVALLVPFTYTLSPHLALILLVSIYIAANYGGSITAITINAPGTPSAVVTAFDGYPLAKKGKSGKALGFSLIASSVGGMIGTLILIFFSVPMAKLAVKFHPAEYFALALFGLTTVASLGGKNWAKAFAAALLGLLINTIGIDPISGAQRFTFGIEELYDGFSLIPALIGLFALSEVLRQIEEGSFTNQSAQRGKSQWPTFIDYWRKKFVILRSSVIGTLIGIFPGAGATIASFISYDVTRKLSRDGEEFGKGNIDGVCASEAANSSSVGGALVPLLTLGIPGSASTAVLIGAMMIHDLNPGPQLFNQEAELVYSLFAALLIANLVLLLLGLVGSRLWIKVTIIPKKILFPLIFAISIIGAYSVRFSIFDVISCLGFGVLGWLLIKRKFPVAPIVLGMVLGNIMETNFRRAVMMEGYKVFFIRPGSLIMILVALASFLVPLLNAKKTVKHNDIKE